MNFTIMHNGTFTGLSAMNFIIVSRSFNLILIYLRKCCEFSTIVQFLCLEFFKLIIYLFNFSNFHVFKFSNMNIFNFFEIFKFILNQRIIKSSLKIENVILQRLTNILQFHNFSKLKIYNSIIQIFMFSDYSIFMFSIFQIIMF